MSDFDFPDEKMRRCALAMRAAFFAEVGNLDALKPGEPFEVVRALLTILTGEFLYGLAHVKNPEVPLVDAAMKMLEIFVAANQDNIAEMTSRPDVEAFLRGTHWEEMSEAEVKAASERIVAGRIAQAQQAALAQDAAGAVAWSALPDDEKAKQLYTAVTLLLNQEKDIEVALWAAQQVAGGAMASVLGILPRHRRDEHRRRMIKEIQSYVDQGIDQVEAMAAAKNSAEAKTGAVH